MGFSSLPRSDFKSVYRVATVMVGMERKKENSSAAARDIPTSCPAAIVDMEREVPGKTADRIWQGPIQMAWPAWVSSLFPVWMGEAGAPGPALSQGAFMASITHITMPPIKSAAPIT